MSSIYRLADAAAEMASLGSSVHHIGCLRACLDPASDLAALNFAIPWASPWSYEQVRLAIARLRQVFGDHQRSLRVSFVRDAWPWLPSLLEDAGLVVESAVDLMVCTPETFRPSWHGHTVSLLDAAHPEPFVEVEAAVFPEETAEPRLVSYQIANGFWRCAAAYAEGRPVAAGSLVPQGRVAELAAMATLAGYRRQGYGSALASLLIHSHFSDGGDLVWLGATSPPARRVYASIGFRDAGSRVTFAQA